MQSSLQPSIHETSAVATGNLFDNFIFLQCDSAFCVIFPIARLRREWDDNSAPLTATDYGILHLFEDIALWFGYDFYFYSCLAVELRKSSNIYTLLASLLKFVFRFYWIERVSNDILVLVFCFWMNLFCVTSVALLAFSISYL